MLFTVAGATLSLGKGRCYTLSVLTMQQFSIRNICDVPGFCHIPRCCSSAQHRSRTKRCYLIVTCRGAPPVSATLVQGDIGVLTVKKKQSHGHPTSQRLHPLSSR